MGFFANLGHPTLSACNPSETLRVSFYHVAGFAGLASNRRYSVSFGGTPGSRLRVG